MTVQERLSALRRRMEENNLDAYVVFSSDPHGSEYVSDHWRCRSWITGFTGSAGIAVITSDEAGLWTDFRYFIQAAEELSGSGVKLFKMNEPDVPSYLEWISSSLKENAVIGMDGRTLTLKEWEAMAQAFGEKKILIDGSEDLIGSLWIDRPDDSLAKVWSLSEEESGESTLSRIERIRAELKSRKMDATLIASLDDVAWTLNVRGGDVPYNPVVQSFLYLSQDSIIWFVDGSKIGDDLRKEMNSRNVEIRSYGSVKEHLSSLRDLSLYLSPDRINSSLMSVLSDSVLPLKGVDISTRMKAEKNPVEQERLRHCMEKDGTAVVRFIRWIRDAVDESGSKVTELKAASALRGFRAEQDGFLSESFSPIPAYKAHGAICHYEAEEISQFTIGRESLFLIDSGGQYKDGTTDITRTLSMGTPSAREKHDYTLVLKGHIALSIAVYPEGTRGYQLDLLARQPLWNAGLNYGHGTGHGVGYILNVHEGPQRISSHPVDEALKPGMITSNEPGIYREGEHGIRIENLIMTVPWKDNPEVESFYAFETMTLCPYEQKLIDRSLLDNGEKSWINAYHNEVLKRLSPYLNEEEVKWLREECVEIS
ncbi:MULTISPECIES: aminopeptidase P family protein [unclassified Oceanispirochaeta]|uniref:aminopeptidase P family protein n=1 Tax=unclassified Oceanispirochaeta TaxID=2635722 RepID=UPI001314FE64|nr:MULTISPECIES: aminopeptidase P family protein [unclassified Oceanispirochaeta]MBF9016250.1 aminopeptidase P family protein [Oceanispirochaeta sp. M2]NPD72712.1 aminopeptidase P family protein [Oceanispirochaeta sp. M1]